MVTGEAGLGKSRLVAELAVEAEDEGLRWLEGHTLSFGRTISYWPLLEIIQQDAGIDSDDAESERWAKLAARVGALFGEERNEILPYLATLLNVCLSRGTGRQGQLPRRRGHGPPDLPGHPPLLRPPGRGATHGGRVRRRPLAGRVLCLAS